jgi:hypothetical protein
MKTKQILSVLVSFVICQLARAVSPAPDGGYPGENTAEGQNALFSLTMGTFNTGVGWVSLRNNIAGNFNTATGAGALFATTADENTAAGAGALFSNTEGEGNTANGAFALFNNTDHSFNTADGFQALFTNRTGQNNTATGAQALFFNDGNPTNNEASNNAAFGNYALFSNSTGYANSAFGWSAMPSNTSGSFNTAVGFRALGQSISAGDGTVATGSYNTAVGEDALRGVSTGSYNATLGAEAGFEIDTASNVICVGAGVPGISSIVGEVDNSCYIGNIYNAPVDLITAVPVFVDQDGKLGTQGFAGTKMPMPGLQRAHPLAMPNEWSEEHRKLKEQQGRIAELDSRTTRQEATIAAQQKQMDALITQVKEQGVQIQKVSAKTEMTTSAVRMVKNKTDNKTK